MSHPRIKSQFLPRDYIATAEGLIFAVVGFDAGFDPGVVNHDAVNHDAVNHDAVNHDAVNQDAVNQDADRVLGYLRYVNVSGSDEWIKVTSAQNRQLTEQSDYLWHCPRRDCVLPAIPTSRVVRHYRPEDAASSRMEQKASVARASGVQLTSIERTATTIVGKLIESGIDLGHIGITGSLLLGRAGKNSDIDFVLYGREAFSAARNWVCRGIQSGLVQPFSDAQWEDTWRRRGCPMTVEEYKWHEQRKWNKGSVNGFRFDINLVQDRLDEPIRGTKIGDAKIDAHVVNAEASFDWPATYSIDHPKIRTIQTFTATYFGQAKEGERIEANGAVEQLADGNHRMVIGLDRDAQGHYLRAK